MFLHLLPDINRFEKVFSKLEFFSFFAKEGFGDDTKFVCEVTNKNVNLIFFLSPSVSVKFELPITPTNRFWVDVTATGIQEGAGKRQHFYPNHPETPKSIDAHIKEALRLIDSFDQFPFNKDMESYCYPDGRPKSHEPVEEKVTRNVTEEFAIEPGPIPRMTRTLRSRTGLGTRIFTKNTSFGN